MFKCFKINFKKLIVVTMLIFASFNFVLAQNGSVLEKDSICKLCLTKDYYSNETIKKITYSSNFPNHFFLAMVDLKNFISMKMEHWKNTSRLSEIILGWGLVAS